MRSMGTIVAVILGGLWLAGGVQGGVIPTDGVVIGYQQTIFADTYEGDSSLAADTGGYKDYLGGTGSITNTTGTDGVTLTDVLQISTSGTGNGLRCYFTTADPVDPQNYTLNYNQDYDPGKTHSNYIRISFDWKPVTGYAGTDDAYDSFGATMRTESAPNAGTGSQGYMTGTYQRYNEPPELSGWHLSARGPGKSYLSGGGYGEVYSTGSNPDLVPDGRWYHIVAEFSVPDASENYDWSMAFTPYSGGVLDTAATATTGGSGTFSAGALYSYFDLGGAARTYTWYVDNLQAELLVLVPPPQGTVVSIK